jgi:Uncharacterized protein involved in tellurite resistance
MSNEQGSSTKVTELNSIGQEVPLPEYKLAAEQEIDQDKVQVLVSSIDITESSAVMAYGAKPMGEIARFADTLLTNVKAKDAGEVGTQLSELVMKIREYDPMTVEEKSSSFLGSIPVIGSLFKKAEKGRVDQLTLTQQVDSIAGHLDQSMVKLLRDIETLEQLYMRNFDFYKEITLFVEAGKQRLQLARTNELVVLEEKAKSSQDLMDAQKVKDFIESINRFERRLHDLELSKVISVQTAPQIRMIQGNNQQLAEKIQSSILSTLPIWKSQMVLSLSLDSQKKAAQLQKEVSDTTNELLRKNAEILEQNSIATATEVERSVVDIDTLREVQNRLVNTIEETMKIASDARERRAEVEKELGTMEEDLRLRLTAAVDKYK